MKGQIPLTDVCILKSIDAQWSMLSRGLISELPTSALIDLASGPQVKIHLVLTRILAPGQTFAKSNFHISSDLGNITTNGLARTTEFLHDYLSSRVWLMMGYIEGAEKKPIFLIHCPQLNLTIYSQKLKDEEVRNFFPSSN